MNVDGALNVEGGGPSRLVEHEALEDPSFLDDHNVLAPTVVQETNAQTMSNQEATLQAVEKFPVFSAITTPKPALKSVIFGPSKPHDPLITVVPSLLKRYSLSYLIALLLVVFSSFYPCWILIITIPSYFNDNHLLVHLAFLLHP